MKDILLHGSDSAALYAVIDWLIDQGDSRGEQLANLLKPIDLDFFWRHFGLQKEHAAYLKKFSETRRMKRFATKAMDLPDPIRESVGLLLGKEAGYFVGGLGFAGQDSDPSVAGHNQPPSGQPGLWCKWAPDDEGTTIAWNGAEKFYDYVGWLEYLLEHFLVPWGYQVNGRVLWQGENPKDTGAIVVLENRVKAGNAASKLGLALAGLPSCTAVGAFSELPYEYEE